MKNTSPISALADLLKPIADTREGERDLFEGFLELTDNEIENPADEFYTIYMLLQDITCALTNPAFSLLLNKGHQANAGRVLQHLLSFFRWMYDNESIHKLIFYKWIDSFPGQVNIENISETANFFIENNKA